MQLHNLKRTSQRKQKKTVGRGGKRGKTSGKGGKGQTARAGHRIRPEIRDVIKKLPKLRGYNFPTIGSYRATINLADLESNFESGEVVTKQSLVEKGLLRAAPSRKSVKLLGDGDITKKLSILGFVVSKSAREKIEKAGGTIN